jgi:iron complex transport system substrate-binding protein
MRIVSFLPAATEIVCALGLADRLVGVTHSCDFPESVVDSLPRVTQSLLPDDADAAAIDAAVRAAQAGGQPTFAVDIDRLRTLAPDIVLGQGLCDACAPGQALLDDALAALPNAPIRVDLSAATIDGVLETFRTVAAALGVPEAGAALVETTRTRWDAVREGVATTEERPRTLLLEWPAPPFCAGHWNPELLALAGATRAPWDAPGKPSRPVTAKEIADFAPEILILALCGFSGDRAEEEAMALSELDGFESWPCFQNNECYLVDGDAYINRPGPRLAESAEILATILHPETFTEMLPPHAVRLLTFVEEEEI